jgi:hypothetical protein
MDGNEHQLTPKVAVKWPTVTQMCEWVKMSWAHVSEVTIVKSFKKCGISKILDGSEDHFLYEDTEDENSDSDKEFLGFHERED